MRNINTGNADTSLNLPNFLTHIHTKFSIQIGNHEVAVVEDQGADALFGGNHFGRHQKEEGSTGGGLCIASLRGGNGPSGRGLW